jgi:hypothetical protein
LPSIGAPKKTACDPALDRLAQAINAARRLIRAALSILPYSFGNKHQRRGKLHRFIFYSGLMRQMPPQGRKLRNILRILT